MYKSFASTLTQEQLPFIVSKLANYSVRRMVEQYGIDGALKLVAADEKQQAILERIINEEFNHLPTLAELKTGTWVQFTEPKRYRHVIGRVKAVLKEGIKVAEYTEMKGNGWAPTGQEWSVLADLVSNVISIEPKQTVEQAATAKAVTAVDDLTKKKAKAITVIKVNTPEAEPPVLTDIVVPGNDETLQSSRETA